MPTRFCRSMQLLLLLDDRRHDAVEHLAVRLAARRSRSSTQSRLVSLPGKTLMKCARGMLRLVRRQMSMICARRGALRRPGRAAVAQLLDRACAVKRIAISSFEICSCAFRYALSLASLPSRSAFRILSNRRRIARISPARRASAAAVLARLRAPAPSSSSPSSSSSSPLRLLRRRRGMLRRRSSSSAFGSTRPSTISSMRISSFSTVSASARISAIVVGQAEIAWIMCFRPSSMRLAISISPSRVSSSTEPISRMYMRTGSVVRPNSESTVDSAASACLFDVLVG